MIQATEDRIAPEMPLEISAQDLAAQESEDVRGYLLAERDAEAICRPGGQTRTDSMAMHLRHRIHPAREEALKPACLDQRLVAFHEFDPQTMAPYNRLASSLISGAASQNQIGRASCRERVEMTL